MEESIDIDGLLGGVRKQAAVKPIAAASKKTRVTVGVAQDAAFSFYYEENLELLRKNGAAIRFFSPLVDCQLPEGVSGLYLGGGYPELFAARLEANLSMRNEIKALSRKGLPVFAECGGLMYLGKSLVDKEDRRSAMTGVFPWQTRLLTRRVELGYREVAIAPNCPMLQKGGRMRGHEFHYSTMKGPAHVEKQVFKLQNNRQEGFTYKNCLATYVHLHFASNPAFAKGFVRLCEKYQKENSK
ncbi:MAG: hypothetical protein HZB85_10700 [Deltaproteobacteria bacterium]|nr:hypothetical protein [Deltaproteobacteria bacterium]